jgi:hypothetical protein
MRIEQTARTGQTTRSRKSAATGGSGFSLQAGTETVSTVGAGAASSIQGVEALMALQAVDGRSNDRETAVKRGRQMLDALDELKFAVLEGRAGESSLLRLRSALAATRGETAQDDPLAGVIDEIELRAEVELAKREKQRQS